MFNKRIYTSAQEEYIILLNIRMQFKVLIALYSVSNFRRIWERIHDPCRVCCWFLVEIQFEIDKNVVFSSRGEELENLTSLVSRTSRSMFTLEIDLKSHFYRIKQWILHLTHIERISKGKCWIPSIISITQGTIVLYYTMIRKWR